MRPFYFWAALLAFNSGPSFANSGDLDLTANMYIKHINRAEWFSRERGYVSLVEKNDHMGIRYGIDNYRNVGLSYGTNSMGNKSLLVVGELHYPFHQYIKAGVMAGMANGYKPLSSNGWRFIGGPSLRLTTPYVGATITLYGTEALTINIDIPLKTYLRRN